MSQNINTVDISNDADLEDYVLISVNGSLRRVKVADLKELVDSTEDIVVVDTALSTTSVNPVQNRVITAELNKKANSSDVPTKTSELTNDSGFITSIPSEYVTEEELTSKDYANNSDVANKLDKNQGTTNIGKYLAVGGDGNVTLVDAPSGDGTGTSYILPIANSTTLGGVKPVTKTDAMTQEVGIDSNGLLYTAPSNTSGDIDLSSYQTKTDDTLTTTSKEVVGAINENKDSIDNLSDEKVNLPVDDKGDALNGTSGQLLQSNGDGSTTWVDADIGGDVIDVDAELKEYMNTVKPDIKLAIINKGGTVLETDSFGSYATRISEIPNGISPAQTIPDQTTLIATGLQDSLGIQLNWTDVGADGYLIVKKENIAPVSSADGDIVYNGSYTIDLVDTNVSYGKVYYYRIFPRNSLNQYQGIEKGSIVKIDYISRSGQVLIKDLSVGDIIKFGQYGNSLYTWTVVDTLDKDKGYITVVADQYPGSWQFDAPENASDNPNPTTDRKNSGNNRWAYSNLRQILNSDLAANEWYVAQHEYDVKPNYAGSAGFLKDFTEYEKSIIVNKTNKCILPTVDGGGSETVIDKIWLASSYAMGLEVFQPLEDDHVYEYFIDNNSRSFTSNYWLRTINGTGTANSVRIVNSNGALGNSSASNSVAARPFCQLPTSAYMLWSDSDNAYIFADDSQRNG